MYRRESVKVNVLVIMRLSLYVHITIAQVAMVKLSMLGAKLGKNSLATN
jgi:hypothetical protein